MTAETLPAADSVAGDGESVCSVSINGASHLPIAGAMPVKQPSCSGSHPTMRRAYE